MKTALVIPCFMAKMLKKVLKGIPKFVNFIILVDDNCPEKTVSYTLKTISDKEYTQYIINKILVSEALS